MRKLLIVFFLLLLLGVAVDVSANESFANKPFCYTEKGLNNLVDVLNQKASEDETRAVIEAHCIARPTLIIVGKIIGTVRLGVRLLNVKEVLVLGYVSETAILLLPEPVVMYGTFPLDGKEA